MTSLYICYQSVNEPLTQTQVIAYLEGLAQAGFRMLLLTFEPRRLTDAEVNAWRQALAAKGITWYWLRYHKWPSVPATAWDILIGVAFGFRLVRRHRVLLVHARAHVPGLMALILKRCTGVRFLFDVRGLMAEEYADAGVWRPGGWLYRTTKRVEHWLVRAADALVVLTQRGKELLQTSYPEALQAKCVEVIPCCVDLRSTPLERASPNGQAPTAETIALAYAGKLGGWYLNEEMVRYFAVAREALPGLRWTIWTQSDPTPLKELLRGRGLESEVDIGRTSPAELPARLRRAKAAIALIKPCVSKVASSPTKIAEYLNAGLPIVSTAGIGDLDSLLADTRGELGGPIGVIVPDCSESSFRASMPRLVELVRDPAVAKRCRAAARKYFDLEQVGWPRYRAVYERLLEINDTGKGRN